MSIKQQFAKLITINRRHPGEGRDQARLRVVSSEALAPAFAGVTNLRSYQERQYRLFIPHIAHRIHVVAIWQR
jgi:hypothetical protein